MSHTGPVTYGAAPENRPRHPLDVFFAPRSVALVGASDREGSVGRKILWNLIKNPFGGAVYAVNPSRRHALGIHTYPSVTEVPESIDLAVIITPADTVPHVLDDCIAAGVKGALIVSAGFTERGERGRALEAQIRERVRNSHIRVIGPNSLGIMSPVSGLNAAFAADIALKGSVGFISQSGALCASVLDWSFQVKTGFSAFVSFGYMIDVQWSDVIYYLGNDPNTKSIVIYMESIGDARSFLSAAREVALTKPIIVLKAGQTEAGARAAQASPYSSTDTCDDAVLTAALARCGVLRVDDVETLFSMADALGKQPRPKGPRLTIVSNAAGPGVLATDALVAGGGVLAQLAPETRDTLNALLPSYWNHSNPVDIVADADPSRFARAVETVIKDPNTDGVLVILTPQPAADPERTADALGYQSPFQHKPILASWMGGETVAQGVRMLSHYHIPTFPYPDTAARIFATMWRYSYTLRGLYETPQIDEETPSHNPIRAQVETIIAGVRNEGRTLLTEAEGKAVLAAYGIPVAPTRVAHTPEEAVAFAEGLGYPVSMKNNVRLASRPLPVIYRDLSQINADEVRRAFESLKQEMPEEAFAGVSIRPAVRTAGYQLVIRSRIDPQFGPYLVFGPGGPLAGVLRDRAIALPPINTTLARRVMERTRVFQALQGAGGSIAVNTEELARIFVRFGDLVIGQRWIREIEINPLLATASHFMALDVNIVLHDPDTREEEIPQPAIRPYPIDYITHVALPDGAKITLRPVRPEDEAAMVRFHETLSSETVYFRYLRLLSLDQRIRHERLTQLCFVDYDRQIGLVAVRPDSQGNPEILAISRMVRLHNEEEADFALVVSDAYQGRGLGTMLMNHLITVARAEGIVRMIGSIHPENTPMLRLCAKLGFTLSKPIGEEVEAALQLTDEK